MLKSKLQIHSVHTYTIISFTHKIHTLNFLISSINITSSYMLQTSILLSSYAPFILQTSMGIIYDIYHYRCQTNSPPCNMTLGYLTGVQPGWLSYVGSIIRELRTTSFRGHPEPCQQGPVPSRYAAHPLRDSPTQSLVLMS